MVGLVRQGLLELVLGEGADSKVPGGDVVEGVGVGGRFGAAVTNAGAGGVAAGGAGLGAEATGAALEGRGVDGAFASEAARLAVEGEDRAVASTELAAVGGVVEGVAAGGDSESGATPRKKGAREEGAGPVREGAPSRSGGDGAGAPGGSGGGGGFGKTTWASQLRKSCAKGRKPHRSSGTPSQMVARPSM